MKPSSYDIGMVGLGVMGRNLVLNIADHEFSAAGYDLDPQKLKAMQESAEQRPIRVEDNVGKFVQVLKKPRAVMMLVPAGAPVDAVIRAVLPHLDPGDMIIDGGNSYYKDTDLRGKTLAEKGILYLGVGISGGEQGARTGPAMMPGGPREGYDRVKPIFEAISAQVNREPCVAYLGPGSAGHYVKMVHNGLEYGLMQLIAESYDLMKRGYKLSDEALSSVFCAWDRGELNAYLVEITAKIFDKVDPTTGKRLVDEILDEARQKGTGKWTTQDAMDLQIPVPTIDAAVAWRDLSVFKQQREEANRFLKGPDGAKAENLENVDRLLARLKDALYAGMVLNFAQGMALLRGASQAYGYHLDLATIARIWRGGCIIRAALLDIILKAFQAKPDLENLLLDHRLGQEIVERRQAQLRDVVLQAVNFGIPLPSFSISLAYYDGFRSAWSPANLIQAQRDYFGAHTYERVDTKGVFHTEWTE